MILSLIGFKLRLRIFRYTNDNNTINRVEAKHKNEIKILKKIKSKQYKIYNN